MCSYDGIFVVAVAGFDMKRLTFDAQPNYETMSENHFHQNEHTHMPTKTILTVIDFLQMENMGLVFDIFCRSRTAKGNWITSLYDIVKSIRNGTFGETASTKLAKKKSVGYYYKYPNFDVELNGDPVAIAVAFDPFTVYF